MRLLILVVAAFVFITGVSCWLLRPWLDEALLIVWYSITIPSGIGIGIWAAIQWKNHCNGTES